MKWDERIIDNGLIAEYSGSNDPGLSARVGALFNQQLSTWPLLEKGYRRLAEAEVKRVLVDGSTIEVQHNPRRIRSTAARVDKESVAARGCFLCPDHLPAEEKGIAYGDLLILCNPYPVLDHHLSIVHREHVPQRISGNIDVLLELAVALGPEYFTLYNGPESGASAPDHLHYQACRRTSLPIEDVVSRGDPVAAERCNICDSMPREDFELFTVSDAGRCAVVLRGNNPAQLAAWVEEIADALDRQDRPEPMINLLCRHDGRGWTLYLFPREKHRPSCFYAEGAERIIVSPGAIDMAGILIVPERSDFDRLGPDEVCQIYAEVSSKEETINAIVEEICSSTAEGASD